MNKIKSALLLSASALMILSACGGTNDAKTSSEEASSAAESAITSSASSEATSTNSTATSGSTGTATVGEITVEFDPSYQVTEAAGTTMIMINENAYMMIMSTPTSAGVTEITEDSAKAAFDSGAAALGSTNTTVSDLTKVDLGTGGYRTTIETSTAQGDVKMDMITFIQGDTAYVVIYGAAPADYDTYLPVFDDMVDSIK